MKNLLHKRALTRGIGECPVCSGRNARLPALLGSAFSPSAFSLKNFVAKIIADSERFPALSDLAHGGGRAALTPESRTASSSKDGAK